MQNEGSKKREDGAEGRNILPFRASILQFSSAVSSQIM